MQLHPNCFFSTQIRQILTEIGTILRHEGYATTLNNTNKKYGAILRHERYAATLKKNYN